MKGFDAGRGDAIGITHCMAHCLAHGSVLIVDTVTVIVAFRQHHIVTIQNRTSLYILLLLLQYRVIGRYKPSGSVCGNAVSDVCSQNEEQYDESDEHGPNMSS